MTDVERDVRADTWQNLRLKSTHGVGEEQRAARREEQRRMSLAQSEMAALDESKLRALAENDASPGLMADVSTQLGQEAGINAEAELLRNLAQTELDRRQQVEQRREAEQETQTRARQAEGWLPSTEPLRTITLLGGGVVGFLVLLSLLEGNGADRGDRDDEREPVDITR